MSHASLLIALCLTADPAAGRWQAVTLVEDGKLAVRLKVLRRASLADFEWLALEFANRGDAPLTVAHAHYRIECVHRDRKSGRQLGSGGLASGNTFDLFPDSWKTTPAEPVVLRAGSVHRAAARPSDYSSALLGGAPADGHRVDARIHLTLSLQGGRTLETPGAGVPFTFEWTPPDAAGIDALRARLKKLLREPERNAVHSYILDLYLRFPEVSHSVGRDELLAALEARRQVHGGREPVLKSLALRFGGDPVVRDHYRERLQAGDREALDELYSAALARLPLWDRTWVEALVRRCERKAAPPDLQWGLHVLHAHRQDWAGAANVVARLSEAVRKEYPLLEKRVGDIQSPALLERWEEGVRLWAMTGDGAAVAALRPALDDRRGLRSLKVWAGFAGPLQPPLRVCDAALGAILTLLDGSPDAALRKAAPVQRAAAAGRNWQARAAAQEAALNEACDRLIADLKQRLAARDGAVKPGR